MRLLTIGIAILLSICIVSAQSNCQCANNQNNDVVTFGTLNVALSIYDPFKEARRNQLEEYLQANTLSLDVICLQELYSSNDYNAVYNSLNGFGVYRPPGQNLQCSRACSDTEWNSVNACLQNNGCYGADLSADQSETCAFVSCRNEIAAVPIGCQTCVSQRGDQNLETRIAQCAGFNSSQPEFWQDCRFVEGGASDATILTRYPIAESDYEYLNSTFILRTVSYVKLTGVGNLGTVNFFCTHLSADQPNLVAADWKAENLRQIDEVLAFVQSKVQGSNEYVVLAGDFNTGPQVANLQADWPDNYNVIIQAGYENAYLLSLDSTAGAQCDFCASNPLNQLLNLTSSVLNSHIFVKTPFAGCSVDGGIFANENNVQVGNNTLVSVSDHYGVYASLCSTTASGTVIQASDSSSLETFITVIIGVCSIIAAIVL